MRRGEKHASIDKATNGYVVYLTMPPENKDDWDNQDSFIFKTLEEALSKVKAYFKE